MVSNLSYAQVFDQRGAAYHRAMAEHAEARRLEFAELFARRPVQPSDRVLDVPAGGGYLARFLPAGAELASRELAAGFGAGIPVEAPDGDWQAGMFDHVVCNAALHHIDDQAAFVRKLCAHTRGGGTVHLADVGQGSRIATFLDDFVGRYNGTGHHGRYLPKTADAGLFGATPTYFGERPCPWTFADQGEMLDFCMGLFGLQGCQPTTLRDALENMVGVTHDGDGVRLAWQLTYVDLVVDPASGDGGPIQRSG